MRRTGVEQLVAWLHDCREAGGNEIGGARAAYDAMAEAPPASVRLERAEFGGVPCDVLTPATIRRHVLFCHGGGYTLGSAASHRGLAGRISVTCAARVVVPDYRRAPEDPFPAAVVDAAAVWSALTDGGIDAANLALGGDSCGGAMALVLAMAAHPIACAAVFTMSAWTDLREAPPPADDPVLDPPTLQALADQYLEGADPSDWRASPCRGDLGALPPVLMQVGAREILAGDNTRFTSLVRAAGGDIELEVYPEMIHVFQMYADWLDDATVALDRLASFLDRRVPATDSAVRAPDRV